MRNQEDNYTRNSIRKHLLPAMQNTLSFKEAQTAETAPNKFLEKMLALHKEAIASSFAELQALPCLFAQRVIHDFLITRK